MPMKVGLSPAGGRAPLLAGQVEDLLLELVAGRHAAARVQAGLERCPVAPASGAGHHVSAPHRIPVLVPACEALPDLHTVVPHVSAAAAAKGKYFPTQERFCPHCEGRRSTASDGLGWCIICDSLGFQGFQGLGLRACAYRCPPDPARRRCCCRCPHAARGLGLVRGGRCAPLSPPRWRSTCAPRATRFKSHTTPHCWETNLTEWSGKQERG